MLAFLKKNPLVYLSARVWEYSRGNRKSVVTYLSLFLLSNVVVLASPLILSLAINTIQRDGVRPDTLHRILGILSLLIAQDLLFWALHGPARVMENESAFQLKATYKQHLLNGVLGLPVEWHSSHHTGDTIDKVEKGASNLFHYAESTFLIIQIVFGLTGACLMLAYFSPLSGIIAIAIIAMVIAMIMLFDRVLVKQYIELGRAENRISEKVVDIVTNIMTVVILRIQKPLSDAIAEKMTEPFTLYQRSIRLNEAKWALVDVSTKLMVVLVIGTYLWEQEHAGLPVMLGTVYALYGYAEAISNHFFNLAGSYGDILRQRAGMMNAQALSDDFHLGRPLTNADQRLDWRELHITGLTFSYHSEGEGDVHLDDVDFVLTRGERVALIGETGSGKSTLLKVLRELYTPQRAQVSLDGRSLPDGMGSISAEITLVPQEPEIFATTILDNITLGVPHHRSTVERYTDMARFTSVVRRLPRQFDSAIQEKGVNLSGGEKQRLALARGLLACHDKSIVLLDEPTSSVDITNETAIYGNIFEAFGDKAIVSSVHHLHLLPLFDRIYLFRDGRVSASGTFDELVASSEQFRQMWRQYRQTRTEGADGSVA